jgi:MFS family permease
MLAPLGERNFRRIWIASLFSNFGQLVLGIGAAWEMTRLTDSPGMIALVQTAMMLPLMLVALPAGAVADMFNRRTIVLVGLGFSTLAGVMLTALAIAGLMSAWVILLFCMLIGAGVALYSPAWQASISEQVVPEHLPAAVALGTISYNVARSFGPAVGGVIVLMVGAEGAFAANALLYLPLFFAFLLWDRKHVPSRLPPERIDRAIVGGMRYAILARPIRTVLIRAFLVGIAGATLSALAPLVAKSLLGGDAGTFGLLLGASGAGAVAGALAIGRLLTRFEPESVARTTSVISGLSVATMALSNSLGLTMIAMFSSGAAGIVTIAVFNISVQMASPRWVTARALSLFSSALTGGIAIGAAFWGYVAGTIGLVPSLLASAAMLLLLPLLGLVLPLSEVAQSDLQLAKLAHEPEVGMDLTLRSGPVVVELDYVVDPANAREFYEAMRKVERTRLRNGGFDWSLSRDIADPTQWTERYYCPTWGDYLRMRDRFTQADIDTHIAARALHRSDGELRVRRKLVRPFGSVRWQADSPDPMQEAINLVVP